jgi:hypothetical protein
MNREPIDGTKDRPDPNRLPGGAPLPQPVNTFDQLGRGEVYVAYYGADHGRGGTPAVARVHRIGFLTDPNPDNYWRNFGSKTFFPDRGARGRDIRKTAEVAAMAWAGERYGITAWVRNGQGDLIPADVAKKVARIRGRGR